MKRSHDEDDATVACRQPRVSSIRLNVGGQHFESTEATLARSTFFEPILSGRFRTELDTDGRLFIDRSPDLFAILLEWMRTLERPSEKHLSDYGDAIMKECAFFGIETGLPDIVQGSLAPDFYMRYTDRRINADEDAAQADPFAYHQGLLLDVHKEADMQLRPREDLQQPLLLTKAPRPTVQGDYSVFYQRMNRFSDGLLDELREIKNIVIAGGSVLAALCDIPHTDIDVFIVGPAELGEICLRQIFAAVQRHHAKKGVKKRYLITRSLNAFTFYLSSVPGGAPPIQVILRSQASVAELLCGFDVDSSCFAFSPAEARVWCTLRGQRAVQHSANILDSARAGTSYCRRHEKYAERGFAIAVPGHQPDRVCSEFLNADYAAFPGHDAIFCLGELQRRPGEIRIAHPNHSFAAPSTVATVDVMVSMKQRATVVRDVERLIVKDRLNIRQLAPPEIKCCEKHKRLYTESPHVSNACIPVSTGAKDEYWLLWGVDAKEDSSSASGSEDSVAEEEGSFETTPLARIYEIMRKNTDREFEADDAATGGIMKTLAGRVASDIRYAVDLVIAQLSSGKAELRLVYHVVRDTTTFEQLSWILDAARKPLQQLPPQDFERKYALPRHLEFKNRGRREAVVNDYWKRIYAWSVSRCGCH
jgi:hypothetical protein